jgi:hypothetical protein
LKREAFEQAIQTSADNIFAFMDAQAQLYEQQVQAISRLLTEKQRLFDEELRLAELGYANNVQGARRDLLLQKQQYDQAQRQAERFRKTQLAANTALEASNMAVAIANVFKTLGPAAPFFVGLMIASFIAAKFKAFQAARKQTFRKGGYREITEGGSHESGRDTFVGNVAGGPGYAEYGESVGIFTKKATRKHGAVIRRFVAGVNGDRPADILAASQAAASAMTVYAMGAGMSTEKVEKKLDTLIQVSEQRTYIDADGNLVVTDRGRKRKYLKRLN